MSARSLTLRLARIGRTGVTRRVPTAYTIDHNAGLAVHVWHGTVTMKESVDEVVRMAADADWPPEQTIVDLTTVGEFVPPDVELLRELMDGSGIDAADFLIAFVVPPSVSIDEIERESAERGLTAAQTFSDLTAACTALGMDKERVERMVDTLRQSLV